MIQGAWFVNKLWENIGSNMDNYMNIEAPWMQAQTIIHKQKSTIIGPTLSICEHRVTERRQNILSLDSRN